MSSSRSLKRAFGDQPSLGEVLVNQSSNSFNLVRLLAAAAVIFGHSFVLSRSETSFIDPAQRATEHYLSGTLAVAVFFLVSGIFVTQSLDRDRSLTNFLIKRGLRIWPGLIVCLCASAALAAIFNDKNWAEILANRAVFYRYVINGSMLNFDWTVPGAFYDRAISTVNGSLWSLLLEVRMYAILAFLGAVGIAFRRDLIMPVALFLAATAFATPDAISTLVPVVRHAIVACLYFLAGIVFYAYRADVRITLRHMVVPFVLIFLTQGFAREVVLHAFIVAAVLWVGSSPYLASFRIRADYSYGIYLYGFPMQQVAATLWPNAGPYLLTILALPLAAGCAAFSWHLVERPALIAARCLIALGQDKAWFHDWRIILRGVAMPALIVLAASLGAMVAAE